MLRDAEQLVREAYRWILGREVDAAGLASYSASLENGSLDLTQFRRILIESEEFRAAGHRPRMVALQGSIRAIIDAAEAEFPEVLVRSGAWAPHLVAVVRNRLRPGDVFADVGANVGVMSFHAAQVVGKAGRVIAFEPNGRNIDCFLRGVLVNGFENVRLFPMAVSDRNRVLSLPPGSNSNAMEFDADTLWQVTPAVPADSILLPEERVTMVRLSAGGHVAWALEGMLGTLERHKPAVLCDFNPGYLKRDGKVEPYAMARRIFSFTRRVTMIEPTDERFDCHSADHLMQLWKSRDQKAAAAGQSAAGALRVALLFDVN